MSKTGQKQLRWTLEEGMKVLKGVVEYLKEQPEKGMLDAFRTAQQVLPEERRKKLYSMNHIPSMLLNMAHGQLSRPNTPDNKEGGETENSLREVFDSLPPPPSMENKALRELNEALRELASPPEGGMLEGLVSDLAHAIGTQLGELLASHLLAASRTIIQDAQLVLVRRIQEEREGVKEGNAVFRPNMPPKAEAKEKNPKILVIGPLPGQQEQLKQQYGSKLDLRFVSSQEGAQLVGIRAKDCDMVVCMRFMNHSHSQSAVSTVGRDKVVFVEGGMTALSRVLDTLVVFKKPAAPPSEATTA